MKKYYDENNNEYKVGDIVLNTSFGDLWVVYSVTSDDKKKYGLNDDLCLALNNDKDDYIIDITEPKEFIIYRRLNGARYIELLDLMKKESMKKQELENK